MNITSAKYIQAPTTEGGTPVNKCVLAIIDDQKHLIPMKEENRHYAEVLKWVEDGGTIEDA